jgi:hypothetical protein
LANVRRFHFILNAIAVGGFCHEFLEWFEHDCYFTDLVDRIIAS